MSSNPRTSPSIAVGLTAVFALLAAGFAWAGADTTSAPSPAPTATPVLVTIANFAFAPATVTIPVGGSVTWKNTDLTEHTATAKNGAFDSGNLDTGQTFTFTFHKALIYTYVCSYHPSMVGTVVVQTPAPTASGSP